MNEFDQFIKHELKVKWYARYTDDFLIISESEDYLKKLLPSIEKFLNEKLRLELHPKKVGIKKFHDGIDFLGYVNFPHHRLLRTGTKKRIWRKVREKIRAHKAGLISEENLRQSMKSYLGVLSHADTYELTEDLKNKYWFWLNE